MNILFVSQNYHPFLGGVETQARELCFELSKRHCVTVAAGNFAPSKLPRKLGMLHTNLLAPNFPSFQDGPVAVHALTPNSLERLRMLPISLRAVPRLQRFAYHPLNRFGYPFFRSVYLPRLRALMAKVDVVHSLAGGYLGWTAQEAATEKQIPFLCTPYVHPKQWGEGPDDVKYYRKAQAVIALLESDKRYLHSIGVPEHLLHVVGVFPLLPSQVEPLEFRQRHSLVKGPVILYVGRMMPQKGAKTILDAAPGIWEEIPEARFVFIGPETQESKNWFTSCDPRILYLGKVSEQEKADALAACDIFCMPSLSEILPAVYLEAWSYAKPVIGGKADGLPELIEGNGGGITVEQDRHQLRAEIVSLLRDPDRQKRYGAQGCQLVKSHYSLHSVVASLEKLYFELRQAGRGVCSLKQSVPVLESR